MRVYYNTYLMQLFIGFNIYIAKMCHRFELIFRFILQNSILEKYIIKKEDAFLYLLLFAFHQP